MRASGLFAVIAVLVALVVVVACDPWGLGLLERLRSYRVVEAASVAVLVLLGVMYFRMVRPLRAISNGMDLLRAQDFSSRLASVNSKEIDLIVNMFNTMMGQLKDERLHMREQNHFFDLIVSVSPMGIVILDTYGKITTANPSALSFFKRSLKEVKGRRLDEIGTTLPTAISKLAQNEIQTLRLSDSMVYRCSRLSFMDNGFAHPYVLIERMTDEVVKSEKRAYEKVIRMIAHEVNNSIAGVNSTLDTSASIIEESDEANELADVVPVLRVCQERCVAMSRFITSFAEVVKIPEANLVRGNLNERVLSCVGFMESMCNKCGVELKFNLSDKAVDVMIDEVLFEQALLNILKNSIESIGTGGMVEISTTHLPPTLTVTDNGPGISDEARERLFTPFYSSKPQGHGLGLIFISDVLTKHGCRFSLTTSPTDGLTRFFITFPTKYAS